MELEEVRLGEDWGQIIVWGAVGIPVWESVEDP